MSSSKTPATCTYTIDQAVEVSVTDFATPGFPTVWATGTVTAIAPLDGGLWDVTTTTQLAGINITVVGKRGGNKNIRAVAA